MAGSRSEDICAMCACVHVRDTCVLALGAWTAKGYAVTRATIWNLGLPPGMCWIGLGCSPWDSGPGALRCHRPCEGICPRGAPNSI